MRFFAGKSGFTISMNEVVPKRVIGAKSFTGSYCSFLNRLTLAACGVLVVTISV